MPSCPHLTCDSGRRCQAYICCLSTCQLLPGGRVAADSLPCLAGVTYVQNTQLPGSTMTLRGVDMVIKNSSFAGLQSFGDAAIVFAASNVTFMNATFTMNNNSAGAACALRSFPAQ